MPIISYAQNFEDVMLWRALGGIEQGFYIDVGAADPVDMSVTKAFYDAGWRGVNIEPGRHYFERLREARPEDVNLDVALAERPGSRVFHEIAETGLSTLHDEVAEGHRRDGFRVSARPVTVMTLADVCRTHATGDIHFLKIDVEGAETDVIAGGDFERFRPWIILLEATEPGTTTLAYRWEPMLLAARYEFVWFDGLNRFYVAAEHLAAVKPHFRLPPNSFDLFTIYDYKASLVEQKVREQTNEIDLLEREMLLLRAMQEKAEARGAGLEEAQEGMRLREDRVQILERHIKLMNTQAAALNEQIELFRPYKITVDRLALSLRWPDGPRVLKLVLPLARILRRLTGRAR